MIKLEPKDEKKLELEFKFYLRSSVRIRITEMSELFEYAGVNKKLYTDSDGFIVETGYIFSFDKSSLTIPTYMPYRDYDDAGITAYFNFNDDMDRYDSLRRLYKYLFNLSQSRIFQYNNQGNIQIINDKWILY